MAAGHDVHAQNAGDYRQQSREKGRPEEKRRGSSIHNRSTRPVAGNGLGQDFLIRGLDEFVHEPGREGVFNPGNRSPPQRFRVR
jgi:hypothetical protein